MEGINAIVTGELTSLSEQELIDCDTSRDHGCHGGLMDFAFGFIMQNGGIDTERDYRYLALEEACNAKKEHRHIVTIDGYQDVPPNDEKSLLKVRTCRSLLIQTACLEVIIPQSTGILSASMATSMCLPMM